MNVMMTGRRRCALALLLAALVLSGCGKKDAPDAPEQTAQTAAYSNLSDEASKELLSELFADAGIAAERADKFFACLDQFNGSVKAEWLTDGFETAAPTETKYDPYEMQEMWMERQGDFPGYNCRITAYELMGDRITAGEDQPDTDGEDWLFMDLETLKRDRTRSAERARQTSAPCSRRWRRRTQRTLPCRRRPCARAGRRAASPSQTAGAA